MGVFGGESSLAMPVDARKVRAQPRAPVSSRPAGRHRKGAHSEWAALSQHLVDSVFESCTTRLRQADLRQRDGGLSPQLVFGEPVRAFRSDGCWWRVTANLHHLERIGTITLRKCDCQVGRMQRRGLASESGCDALPRILLHNSAIQFICQDRTGEYQVRTLSARVPPGTALTTLRWRATAHLQRHVHTLKVSTAE